MNLQRTRAVARKEAIHILRDYRSLAVALGMPVVLLALFGYALSMDVDRITTASTTKTTRPQAKTSLISSAAHVTSP